MIKRIKTGVFSGSFNPIHIGHLALANYLCEFEDLDEVWFVVSPLNPFKNPEHLIPETKRLELIEIATRDYPHFQASDVEISLPRPSYTVNTLEYLKDTYPEREFTLIIGSDNWNFFDRWKESNRIIARNKILIYPRPGYPVDRFSLSNTVRLAKAPLIDVSATFVRESLAAGKNIYYFLHPEVYKKIKEEGLYTT